MWGRRRYKLFWDNLTDGLRKRKRDKPKQGKRLSMQESSPLLPTIAKKVNLYLSESQGLNRTFLASESDAGDGQDHDAVALVPGKNPGTNRIRDRLDPRAPPINPIPRPYFGVS